MYTEEQLIAAMRAAPDSEGPRLVYADWLMARGDPRGELILLDHREHTTPGGLTDRAALMRLLVLAAEHGFPRLPDDPDARILPFEGGGHYLVQYELDYQGHNYYLRWRDEDFSIYIDNEIAFECALELANEEEWTDEETNVILAIVSDAILSGVPLSGLALPDSAGIRAHPDYRVGRCPGYVFPAEFMASLGLDTLDWALPRRDRDHWYALWRRVQATR